MNNTTIPNSIYLENLPFSCNEQDIYKKLVNFGSIKRIKIFHQIYQDTKYSTGYALVQFSNNSGKQKCLENGKFIGIKKNMIRIYDTKPLTKLVTSCFVFYSDQGITQEKINTFFINYKISDITIRANPTLNHLGFAIIQFQSKDVFEYILPKTRNSLYQIIFPSNELIELWPTKENRSKSQIIFNPDIFIDYEKFTNFEIIHDSTPYRVNSYLACIYSTRINQLFMTNSILDRIETRIKINGDFTKIADFLLGKEIKITQEDAQFIFLISADLGIESLLHESYGFVYSQMNSENAMFFYRELRDIELPIDLSPHIRYMAENVSKMRLLNDFKSSSTELISSVLYYLNNHIKSINLTSDEAESFTEWLIGFINQNKDDRKKLLQFIMISSIPKIKTISIINDTNFNINLIRRPILKFLLQNKTLNKDAKSLISDSDDSDDPDDVFADYKVIRCQNNKNDDRDFLSSGVFKWYFDHYKENPSNIDIVSVTSSTSIHKIIEYNDIDDFWSSTDMPNSWIMIDFKEYEIIPSLYTIKTIIPLNYDDEKTPSLISWDLEGSIDGSRWTLLDKRRNISPNFKIGNKNQYKIDQIMRCRYIRLTQIGKNNADDFTLNIQNIEFFGELPRQNKKIEYNDGTGLGGIFSFLISKLGRNPVLLKKIEISSSCDAKFLIDKKWKGTWKSPNKKKSWVKIDLMLAQIDLLSYALKSHNGPGFFRSWVVEVSNNDKDWYIVDKKVYRNDYDKPYQWIIWTCQIPYKSPVRYVKFTMSDLSEDKDNIFWLSGIELFGDLIIPK